MRALGAIADVIVRRLSLTLIPASGWGLFHASSFAEAVGFSFIIATALDVAIDYYRPAVGDKTHRHVV